MKKLIYGLAMSAMLLSMFVGCGSPMADGETASNHIGSGAGNNAGNNNGNHAGSNAGSGSDDISYAIDEMEEELQEFADSVTWEKVHVTIPGMQGSRQLLYVSDLHIITESDQIAPTELETVRARMAWSSYDGMTAEDAWPIWADYLNVIENDGILFGADMVDFGSRSNVECLKKGLDRLESPWLYVRADHDYVPAYLNGIYESESVGYQMKIDGYKGYEATQSDRADKDGVEADRKHHVPPRRMDGAYGDVMFMEYDEFIVAGWNNSTAQMTPDGLEKMKELFAMGKPIVLLTHVPIQPIAEAEGQMAYSNPEQVDSEQGDSKQGKLQQGASEQKEDYKSLTDASKEAWGERVLLWGNQGSECFYQPNETTQEFLQMIYDENTPVVEILCGHLHFSWDGRVTDKVHQHVFAAALDRHAGIVTLSGQ